MLANIQPSRGSSHHGMQPQMLVQDCFPAALGYPQQQWPPLVILQPGPVVNNTTYNVYLPAESKSSRRNKSREREGGREKSRRDDGESRRGEKSRDRESEGRREKSRERGRTDKTERRRDDTCSRSVPRPSSRATSVAPSVSSRYTSRSRAGSQVVPPLPTMTSAQQYAALSRRAPSVVSQSTTRSTPSSRAPSHRKLPPSVSRMPNSSARCADDRIFGRMRSIASSSSSFRDAYWATSQPHVPRPAMPSSMGSWAGYPPMPEGLAAIAAQASGAGQQAYASTNAPRPIGARCETVPSSHSGQSSDGQQTPRP
ncbi:hypothetical protein DENSPDRAFT_885220 [Dentipellis sp. KUC8613]|nr:hypothetical protein DENSPDRAFT_885220 [Dentipellis sp. KUC8613]